IAFFGVGSEQEREPLENSELDVSASAERAAGVAPFPVAVPAAGEGWSERSARYTAGAEPRWTLEYTSPDGRLITLIEESQLSAPMISSAISGSAVEEEFELEGAACSLLSGGEQGAEQRGIACEGEDWGLVVHGDADREALEETASAAIVSVGGRGRRTSAADGERPRRTAHSDGRTYAAEPAEETPGSEGVGEGNA